MSHRYTQLLCSAKLSAMACMHRLHVLQRRSTAKEIAAPSVFWTLHMVSA